MKLTKEESPARTLVPAVFESAECCLRQHVNGKHSLLRFAIGIIHWMIPSPPAHKAQGIESSYTATINAARPILLCGKRKKMHPHAARNRQTTQ